MILNSFSQLDQFFVGVDPGQSVDPTAVAVIRRVEKYDNYPRYECAHLERLPLQTPYPGIIHHVGRLVAHPLLQQRADVCIDQTGVGAPVCDMFEVSGKVPNLIRVVITAGGDVEKPNKEKKYWSVPKINLVSGVLALLHNEQLKLHEKLSDLDALKGELADFQYSINESGRWRFGARAGRHDDLVLAVALACWRGLANGCDYGLHFRLAGIKPPQPIEDDITLVPGEGQVIVRVKERAWIPELGHWLEPGQQVMVAEMAALLAQYLE
jgi:hypothetical protein